MAELMDLPTDRPVISKEQWVEAVCPDDRQALRTAIETCVGQRCPLELTFRLITERGVRWLYTCGDVWRGESHDTARLHGASMDITESKQTEQALRESEERLRLALDAAGMGSFVWHAAGHRTEADGQMFTLFGLTPDESFSPESPPSTIHPVDRKRYAAAVTRAVDPAGRGELSQEIRVVHPDGQARWLSIRARTAFAGEPQRAVRVAGVAADINDRKQAERELRRLNTQLRESDRRKDDFIAMLGHELRNPLASIRNATDLMKLVAPDDDIRSRRMYDVLDRQLAHMTRLIDGLLEVSRIARGKIYLDQDVLDLRLIIDAIVQDQAGKIESKGLELDYILPSAPIWVHADHVRLAQVFDNLLGNAIKFTDSPGGISVTVEEREGSAIIQVSDTGTGIRPEMLERLFEPFQQETQEIARAAGGLGLGLALAKGLVELHGGNIVARSEGPGTGAEFEVRLPVTSAPAVEQHPERKTDFEFRRILIVEDNLDARQTLHDLLAMLGHDVASVGSGSEAIEALRADHVDVVLCDLGLPGMSGYDVARTIRADTGLHKMRLIALTGYGQPEDRKQSALAGFDDHLTKPVNLEELNRALRKWGKVERPVSVET